MDCSRESNLHFILQHYDSDCCLFQDLQELDRACNEISSYWQEYDYADVQANGFRSFVKKCNLYIQTIRNLVEDGNDPKLLQDYEKLSSAFVKQIKVLNLVRQKDANEHHDKTTFVYPQDNNIIHTLLSFTDKDIRPLYTSPGPFWLDSMAASLILKLNYLLVFVKACWSERAKMLLSQDHFADQVVAAIQNHDINSIRYVSQIAWQFPFNAFAALACYVKGTSTQYVSIAKQNQWLFQLDGPESLVRFEKKNQIDPVDNKCVECLVIKPRDPCVTETLIYHVHGSGFVGMKPGDHERYLREWSKRLNAVVIAPDYAKAPEDPFPCGLQDVLDVYLYLTREAEACAIIGFKPKRIVLTGDSAGGNIAVALLFALNEMNRSGENVIMPIAVSLQCPLANALAYPPSCAQTCFDTYLPSTLTMTVATGYAIAEPPVEKHWYRKEGLDAEGIKEMVTRFAPRIRDPYFNLLAYDRWQELSGIAMHIAVGEYDSLLDSSIDIAKRWCGRLSLDVFERMPHCFLLLPLARKEADLVVEKMQEMISVAGNT